MFSSKKVLLVLIVCLVQINARKRGFNMISTKIIQDSIEVAENELSEYAEINVKLINPGTETAYFDLDVNIFKDLPPDVEINLKVDKLNRKGEYEPTPLTILKNYCTYMTMDKVIYPMIVNKGNFPSKCPVKAGKYYIKHFSTTPKDLRITIPVGSYRIIFAFKFNGKLLSTVWKGQSISA